MSQGLNISVNASSNNILSPITIGNEYTVLGCANVSGNSFVIAPSADLNDNLGLSNNRFANVFAYGMNLGNSSFNSYGNSTANSQANSTNISGYTVLPGGVIMQWGTGAGSTSGNSQPFKVTFPSNVFTVMITGTQANNIYLAASNSSAANVISVGASATYQFLAIGH